MDKYQCLLHEVGALFYETWMVKKVKKVVIAKMQRIRKVIWMNGLVAKPWVSSWYLFGIYGGFSRVFTCLNRSRAILASTSGLKLHKSAVLTSSTTIKPGMPKKGKVAENSSKAKYQEDLPGAEDSTQVISATKDGKISVKILAKPGAKQNNITGKNKCLAHSK